MNEWKREKNVKTQSVFFINYRARVYGYYGNEWHFLWLFSLTMCVDRHKDSVWKLKSSHSISSLRQNTIKTLNSSFLKICHNMKNDIYLLGSVMQFFFKLVSVAECICIWNIEKWKWEQAVIGRYCVDKSN